MKNRIKALLQALLGYERYLTLFAWFKVRTLRWDRREHDFFHFLSRVPPDGVVLDVGANLGFLCVHLAQRVSRGHVIAFEPLPDNHRVLRRMIRRFRLRNVEVYPWAVGDRNESVSMVLPVHGRARQQGLGHVAEATAADGAGLRFVVPMHRLDDLPEINNPWTRIAAIKIDVENFERYVLRGAREILERDRPLLYLELWDNDNRRECLALARELNYSVMVADRHGLVRFDPVQHRRHGNFFFVPEVGRSRATGRVPRARGVQDAWVNPPADVLKFPQGR
jgi:FkbM family methyltransferase